jgi:hypothetical protein
MNLNVKPAVETHQSGLLVAQAISESFMQQGKTVWSELMHPVYEAVAEVREMPNRIFAIWHHHGDPLMAWPDEDARHFVSLDDAVAIVRDYQSRYFTAALH